MGEDEFWHSTPRYFAARQRGWSDERRERLETARTLAFFSVVPHVKAGSIKSPAQLWPLPHDAPTDKPKAPPKLAKPTARDIELLRKMHEQLGQPLPPPTPTPTP